MFTCLYTLFKVYTDEQPFELRYFGSVYHVVRTGKWATFTVQNFTLITLYFTCAVAIQLFPNSSLAPTFARIAFVSFKIVYPLAILITAVVTFVLYPEAVSFGMRAQIDRLFEWPPVIMHNLNVLFLLSELILRNPFDEIATSLEWTALPILFGVWYACFALFWFFRTGTHFYFFMDHRRDYAWATHILLLIVCAVFCSVEHLTRYFIRHGLWMYVAGIFALTMGITQWSDTKSENAKEQVVRS